MSKDGYNLRVFRLEDLDRVIQINSECLPENYSRFFYSDLFRKYPETFIVAEVDGVIQGYIMIRIERGWSKTGALTPARLGHVVSVAVMPDHRRKGIGKAMIIEAMSRSRGTYGASEGYLEVRVTNDPAIGLYEKLGFDKVKRNYGYYLDGEDAWVMAVNLESF